MEFTLLVDGLHLDTSTDDLKAMFAAYGTVLWARVVFDHCGHSLRFGYVALPSEADVQVAMGALKGVTISDRPLLIIRVKAPLLPRPA